MQRIEIGNTRSPAMWDIIHPHVDFVGKSVIDLGCGTGDFLWYAHQAGAKSVHGIDIDKSRCYAPDGAIVTEWDIDWLVEKDWKFVDIDIAFCFSVLPYLQNPVASLNWMHSRFNILLVECQYSGDGPGFKWIKDDDDMRTMLSMFSWKSIDSLGHTMVKENRYKRTIWKCEK